MALCVRMHVRVRVRDRVNVCGRVWTCVDVCGRVWTCVNVIGMVRLYQMQNKPEKVHKTLLTLHSV